MDGQSSKTVRRLGVEGSEVRAQLIDATEGLLGDEGYTAVTARRVAAKAGIKPQLVYYYYRTMDELILAVLRKITDKRLERFEAALASPQPLRALWSLASDPSSARLSSEVTSLVQRREALRAEVNRSAEAFRALQIAAVARILRERGVSAEAYPADALVMLMAALGRTVVTEEAVGLTLGHASAAALVERMLARLEG